MEVFKSATTIVFISLVLSLTACDDVREEKYPNGKVRIRTSYLENVKDGEETEFYESGKVKRIRYFVRGMEQGECREFYESGKLKREFNYKDGAVDGKETRYYENGRVQSITLYKSGTVVDFPQVFDSDGDLEIQGSYEDPRDGNRYEWVRIGNQIWTAENIKFAPVKGSVCMQCNVWGRLYDFESAKRACPTGFRIPKISDFESLAKVVGANPAKKLKASFGWNENGLPESQSGNGTDEFSFGLRASGAHFARADVPEKERKFRDAGEKAYLWTEDGKVAVFKKNSSQIFYESFRSEFGASLRCVRDALGEK